MSHKAGYGLPRTPQALRVLPLVPRIVAEGWSSGKLAREAGIDPSTAARYLRKIASKSGERAERETELATVDGRMIAQRMRDGQIASASRIESLAETLLDDLEAKAATGKLSGKDLDTLIKLRGNHWSHIKELSGVALAEKVALARVKGESTGAAIAAAVNAAHAELEGDVWEAETAPLDEESNGES